MLLKHFWVLRVGWFHSIFLSPTNSYTVSNSLCTSIRGTCSYLIKQESSYSHSNLEMFSVGFAVQILLCSLDKHGESNAELGQLYWPNTSTLTTRLRRLITAYQRSYKRQQMRQEALMKTDRRRRRPREEVRALEAEREAIITEKRQKWVSRWYLSLNLIWACVSPVLLVCFGRIN